MAQFELVGFPLIIALALMLLGIWVILWRKLKLKKTKVQPRGATSVMVLGISLFILAGFSLFTGLFFLITG